MATAAWAFSEPWMEIAAIVNPRKRLPESPIKILAGLKLYRKKPRVAPARAAVKSDGKMLPKKRATAKRVEAAKNATPEANPSIPSIRLKALERPTSQKTVMGRLNHPK
jgi:hypothetical protein